MWLTPFTSLRIREDKNYFQSPWNFRAWLLTSREWNLGKCSENALGDAQGMLSWLAKDAGSPGFHAHHCLHWLSWGMRNPSTREPRAGGPQIRDQSGQLRSLLPHIRQGGGLGCSVRLGVHRPSVQFSLGEDRKEENVSQISNSADNHIKMSTPWSQR